MHKTLLKAVISGTLAIPLAVLCQALAYTAFKAPPTFALLGTYVSGVAAWSIGAVFVALVVLIVYGVPSFLLLRKLRLANIISCCIVAVLPSAAVAIAARDPIYLYQYGYFSVVSALAFWLFARHVALQPNNSFKPKPLRGSA